MIGETTPDDEKVMIRWRKRDIVLAKECQVITISSLVNDYSSCAGMIGRHNCVRQGDLKLENTFEVKDKPMRVNSSLLRMFVSDAHLLYRD